jgi:hypothetical protein
MYMQSQTDGFSDIALSGGVPVTVGRALFFRTARNPTPYPYKHIPRHAWLTVEVHGNDVTVTRRDNTLPVRVRRSNNPGEWITGVRTTTLPFYLDIPTHDSLQHGARGVFSEYITYHCRRAPRSAKTPRSASSGWVKRKRAR